MFQPDGPAMTQRGQRSHMIMWVVRPGWRCIGSGIASGQGAMSRISVTGLPRGADRSHQAAPGPHARCSVSLLQSHFVDGQPTHEEDGAGRSSGGPQRGGGRGNQARLDRLGLGGGRAGEPESIDNGMELSQTAGQRSPDDRSAGTETDSERQLIASFADQVRAAVAPWAAQRQSADLVFDVSGLNSLSSNFREMYRRRFDDVPNPVTMRQALDHGTMRASIREIGSFNAHLGADYYEWLGLSRGDRIVHHYTLTTGRGVNLGDVISGRAVGATLEYHNDLGMRWSQPVMLLLATAEGGPEVSVSTDEDEGGGSSVSLSPILSQGDPLESDPPLLYFSPDDACNAFVGLVEVDASASAGVDQGPASMELGHAGWSGTGIMLQNEGRTVSFPM